MDLLLPPAPSITVSGSSIIAQCDLARSIAGAERRKRAPLSEDPLGGISADQAQKAAIVSKIEQCAD